MQINESLKHLLNLKSKTEHHMPTEIERKFLVNNLDLSKSKSGVYYRQGYLKIDDQIIIRARIYDQKAFVTMKKKVSSIKRLEYEYAIPIDEAEEILEHLCIHPLIEKYRYKINYKGFIWEVDKFLGENEGLVVAEIELENENNSFPHPPWLGHEVSHNPKYYNASLVLNPYKNWND